MVSSDLFSKLSTKLNYQNTESKELVLLIPHSDEPLGLLALDYLYKNNFSVIKNTDFTHNFKFRIPCNFYEFLLNHQLSPMEEQVEFNYNSNTPRIKQLRRIILEKEKIISIHNDPLRNFFYAYSNFDVEKINEHLLFINRGVGCLEEADYTKKLAGYVYDYFPTANIGYSKGLSFGNYCSNQHIQALNIEVPMFDWSCIGKSVRHNAMQAYFQTKGLKKATRIQLLKTKEKEFSTIIMNDLGKLQTQLDILSERILK